MCRRSPKGAGGCPGTPETGPTAIWLAIAKLVRPSRHVDPIHLMDHMDDLMQPRGDHGAHLFHGGLRFQRWGTPSERSDARRLAIDYLDGIVRSFVWVTLLLRMRPFYDKPILGAVRRPFSLRPLFFVSKIRGVLTSVGKYSDDTLILRGNILGPHCGGGIISLLRKHLQAMLSPTCGELWVLSPRARGGRYDVA